MPISTALGMEKMSKYYIRFVRGGVLEGGLEKVIAEESVEDISTGSEEERKLERKREKKVDKDRRKKRKGGGKPDEKRKKRPATEQKEESKEERRERKRLKRLVEKELALLKNGR